MDESKLFWYRAKCIRVVDGDTADFEFDLGFKIKVTERVRMLGYDSAETYGTPAASAEHVQGELEAKRLAQLILNQVCWVQTQKSRLQDKYGRYLATVYVGEADELDCVNDLMQREFHMRPTS